VSGDAEYIAAFLRIVMPVAYEVINLFQQYKYSIQDSDSRYKKILV
jgi:hypothetical protein